MKPQSEKKGRGNKMGRGENLRAAARSSALPPAVAVTALSAPAAEKKSGKNFAGLSIEELMNESVSPVSKKETRLSQSPAAIALVNADDIRRLGITTIPEAPRLVAGMDVARISANEWAVSARGFNHQFAGGLLVLVDGRAGKRERRITLVPPAVEPVDTIEFTRIAAPAVTRCRAASPAGGSGVFRKPSRTKIMTAPIRSSRASLDGTAYR